ncbi:MAG: cation transporter, partial [Salinivenus sp.]
MSEFELEIEGMTCAGCGEHVADALRSIDGVERVHLDDWTDGRASVTAHEDVSPEVLEGAVEEAGYTAHVSSKRPTETAASPSSSGNGSETGYDLLVVGGGSAAFAA